MKLAYADPPYPGCAHRYKGHKDFGGEVDHLELVNRLLSDYDGFILHTSSTELQAVVAMFPRLQDVNCRIMAWVKPFAAFKRNVPVAYAWEPAIVRPCRKPVVNHRIVMRDWISESITLRKGLCGAKPPNVCTWTFEMMGAIPEDSLDDLYPGTGVVSRSWETWKAEIAMTSRSGE